MTTVVEPFATIIDLVRQFDEAVQAGQQEMALIVRELVQTVNSIGDQETYEDVVEYLKLVFSGQIGLGLQHLQSPEIPQISRRILERELGVVIPA